MKKDIFKKKVINACKKYSLNKLLSKQEKRREKNENSKGRKLNYIKIEMQSYLKSNKIKINESKLLFKIRTNMLEVRKNYKQFDNNVLCPLGDNHIDNEENILKCEKLKTDNDSETQFDDLFSQNEEKVAKTLKIFYKKWKTRSNMLEN